jgi:hypothetical protein
MEKLHKGDCEFIGESSDDEHARGFTQIIGPVEPDAQAETAH